MWSIAVRSLYSRRRLPSTKAKLGFSNFNSSSAALASSIRPARANPATA